MSRLTLSLSDTFLYSSTSSLFNLPYYPIATILYPGCFQYIIVLDLHFMRKLYPFMVRFINYIYRFPPKLSFLVCLNSLISDSSFTLFTSGLSYLVLLTTKLQTFLHYITLILFMFLIFQHLLLSMPTCPPFQNIPPYDTFFGERLLISESPRFSSLWHYFYSIHICNPVALSLPVVSC